MYFEIDHKVKENEELMMLRSEVHKFAKEVIRPAAKALDQMNHKDTSKPDSPYYDVMKKMKKNGFHRLLVPEEYGGMMADASTFSVFMEELGWGSLGMATALGVDMIPTTVMSIIGSPELLDEVLIPWMEDEDDKYRGCWAVMDPDRGSDYIMVMSMKDPKALGTKGYCRADMDGDDWIINGVKSYWTSSAPCANWVLTHPLIPPYESPTDLGGALIPLNAPGVTIAPPIDKLGTRDDPQGEIAFDNVRIPGHYMIAAAPEMTNTMMKLIISCTSCAIATMHIGVARACFEEALRYTQERIQGGKPIIEHQLTQYRLYKMFEKIETARYYTRAITKNVFEEVFFQKTLDQSSPHALLAQAYCKEKAFEVAHDALQLFGGSGIMKETLIEKLFRDVRCGMIEDGTVEVLGLEAIAAVIKDHYYTLD